MYLFGRHISKSFSSTSFFPKREEQFEQKVMPEESGPKSSQFTRKLLQLFVAFTTALFRRNMSLPIVPAFMPEFVAIDFESDPIFESKAKILKDLESYPLLISLDCLLEGRLRMLLQRLLLQILVFSLKWFMR